MPGEKAEIGKTTLADIQRKMVEPMKLAFMKGDRDAGLRAFIGYVLRDPQAWDKWSEADRKGTLANVHEWDVFLAWEMTRGN